jgi:succinoglycan biosynthesis transport protein ExoP
VMVERPDGPAAESFRMLRTHVEFSRLSRELRTVLVTSAVQGEGKSTTACNLAVALARAGRNVCLVDLDLRRPRVATYFDLVGRPGITSVALGYTSLKDALASIPLEAGGDGDRASAPGRTLTVLPSGPPPPDPGEFVTTPRLEAVIQELSGKFDYVLVDAPPLIGVNDARTISGFVDGILLVARLNLLRLPMLDEVHRILHESPGQLLGFVLTGGKLDQGYGYGGYYATADSQENGAREAERVGASSG